MDQNTPDAKDMTPEENRPSLLKDLRRSLVLGLAIRGATCQSLNEPRLAHRNPESDKSGDTLANELDPVTSVPAAKQGKVPAEAGPTCEVWAPPPCDADEDSVPPRRAGERGEGPPLAPPGWTWWVGSGRGKKKGKFWAERNLRPTDEFLALHGGERETIRSRRDLENYIQKYHPTVSIEAVMASFVWRVPALRTPLNSNVWAGRPASSVLDLLANSKADEQD